MKAIITPYVLVLLLLSVPVLADDLFNASNQLDKPVDTKYLEVDSYYGSNVKENAVDGDAATGWVSNNAFPAYFQINFTTLTNVTFIGCDPCYGAAGVTWGSWAVNVSNDSVNWDVIGEWYNIVDGNQSWNFTINGQFPPFQFMRIQFNETRNDTANDEAIIKEIFVTKDTAYLPPSGGLNISLYNCSYGSPPNYTITFYLNDETKDLTQAVTFQAWFQVWETDRADYLNFSFNFPATQPHRICINPVNASLHTEAHLRYNSDTVAGFNNDYRTRNYYLHNLTLNGTEQNMTLYLANVSSQATYIYVKDLNDFPIVGAYLHIQRFFPGSNEWRTVEVLKTDLNGQVVAYLFTLSELYRFNVWSAGSEYVVGEQVIATTIITINVDTEGYYADDYLVVEGVRHSVVFTTVDSTFTLQYDDTEDKTGSVCLKVSKLLPGSEHVFGEECNSAQSGTIQIPVSEALNGVYIGEAYAYIDGEVYPLSELEVVETSGKSVFGAFGIFLAMLIIMVMSFVGSRFGLLGMGLLGSVAVIGVTVMGLVSWKMSSVAFIIIALGMLILMRRQ